LQILVVGAGAVGGYFGGLWSAAGRDVTLVVRGARCNEINQLGLTLVRKGSEMQTRPSARASASGVAIVRTGDIWRRPSRYRTPSRASRFRLRANFFSRQSSSRPRCSSHSPAVGGRPRADTIGLAFGSLSR
jgi:hypothetical protein